ncbi:MAG: hypothetical protein MRK02_13810 [Candidatus Scalindua sp.]|nr:hypothetical protein [Candidatus Scalindua sp.]
MAFSDIAIVLVFVMSAVSMITDNCQAGADTLKASHWAEGTQAVDDGAARDYYNSAARLEWENYMGDWRDGNNTAQG